MPVTTAKLSREFYERFGDNIVNELVGVLNQRIDQQNGLFILGWVTLIAAVVGMGLR